MNNKKLKILFVCSGNPPKSKNSGTGEVLIKNAIHQGDSLINMGYDLEYFFIKGRGIWGYLKSIPQIRKKIRTGRFDIIHAHYSLTAIATSLATRRKIVVSLMGSDVFSNPIMLYLIKLIIKYKWSSVIVKSEQMMVRLRSKKVVLLPNGVDTDIFKPMDKSEAKEKIGLSDKKIVLFAANPSRIEKNFQLAQKAFNLVHFKDSILLPVYSVPYHEMLHYMNASNVLLLTSLWEGSVNVVKEAMACNLPVVSTDVGDVKRNTEGLAGYYITSNKPEEIAQKLRVILGTKINIKARDRVFELGLDARASNHKLIDIYNSSMFI